MNPSQDEQFDIYSKLVSIDRGREIEGILEVDQDDDREEEEEEEEEYR